MSEEAEEPSIEEILSSIRQIISDDDKEGEGEGAAVEAMAEPENTLEIKENQDEEDGDEVLDLTDILDEDVENLEPEPERANLDMVDSDKEGVGDDNQDAQPLPPEKPEAQAEPDPELKSEPQVAPAEEDENIPPETSDIKEPTMPETPVVEKDSVITEDAANAALAGFAKLSHNLPLGNSGLTLEEIVKDMVRPMLTEWLDKNLPSIIERLVQVELEKISGKARQD